MQCNVYDISFLNMAISIEVSHALILSPLHFPFMRGLGDLPLKICISVGVF